MGSINGHYYDKINEVMQRSNIGSDLPKNKFQDTQDIYEY